MADGAAAKVSSAVFVCLVAAAVRHLVRCTTASTGAANGQGACFKRIDHANIFLLIAGSYTPITVLCLPPEKATMLLWPRSGAGALLGIGFRIFWIGAPRWLYVPLYLLLGWAAVLFIVDFFRPTGS